MNTNLQKTLFWAPRIAGILFVLFISLFALDVFDMGLGFGDTLIALFMHLIPSFILAAAIFLAWKWEWVGAVLFIGWAVWYIAFMTGFPWIAYLLISGIPMLVGLLFLAGWVWKNQIRVV